MINDGLHPALLGRISPAQIIDNMPAGPEIDLLIAEKIMEYPILDITPPCDHNTTPYMTHIAVFSPTEIHYHRALGNEGKNYNWGIWNPSKNIARVWEVVEKIVQLNAEEKEGWGSFDLGDRIQDGEVVYYAVFTGKNLRNSSEIYADTAPLAICRAALKAVSDG